VGEESISVNGCELQGIGRIKDEFLMTQKYYGHIRIPEIGVFSNRDDVCCIKQVFLT
jgi:hypothetical protein